MLNQNTYSCVYIELGMITGYTVELSTLNGKEYVCKDCADKIQLEHDKKQIKVIEDSQIRYGSGGGICMFCGDDTLSSTNTSTDRPDNFDAYIAALLPAEIVSFAATDSNVENDDESNSPVRFPDLSPASVLDSVLIIETDTESEADTVTDLLEQAGFEVSKTQPVGTYYELLARTP